MNRNMISFSVSMQSPIDLVARLAADSNELNRLIGFDPVEVEEPPVGFAAADEIVLAHGRTKLNGLVPLHFAEVATPFILDDSQWVECHSRLCRRFYGNWLGLGGLEVETRVQRNGNKKEGCKLSYEMKIEPSWWAGNWVIPRMVDTLGPKFKAHFEACDALIRSGRPLTDLDLDPIVLASGWEGVWAEKLIVLDDCFRSHSNLDMLQAAVKTTLAIPQLERMLQAAPNKILRDMCPYSMSQKDALELREDLCAEFLNICAHVGILVREFKSVCPLCHGEKARASRIDDLPTDVNCPPCGLAIDDRKRRLVHVAFRPHESIRVLRPEGLYCLGNPLRNPNTVARLIVPPGTKAVDRIKIDIQPGHYNVLVRGDQVPHPFEVEWGGRETYPLYTIGKEFAGRDGKVAKCSYWTFDNPTGRPQLVTIERVTSAYTNAKYNETKTAHLLEGPFGFLMTED